MLDAEYGADLMHWVKVDSPPKNQTQSTHVVPSVEPFLVGYSSLDATKRSASQRAFANYPGMHTSLTKAVHANIGVLPDGFKVCHAAPGNAHK
jgi:hypothetical protein